MLKICRTLKRELLPVAAAIASTQNSLLRIITYSHLCALAIPYRYEDEDIDPIEPFDGDNAAFEDF